MSLVHPDDHEKAIKAMRNHFKGDADKYETDYRIQTNRARIKISMISVLFRNVMQKVAP
jgi:hypothetical protein